MHALLRRLGARLAPPRRVLRPLPPELGRFYAITDGADVPRLRARLSSLAELDEADGLLPFAAHPEGRWSVVAEGPLRGWVVRAADRPRLAFRSVTSLLSSMVGALENRGPVVEELAETRPSADERELAIALLREAGAGAEPRWLALALDLLGAEDEAWLRRAAALPGVAAAAAARLQELGRPAPSPADLCADLRADLGADLRTLVTEALTRRGWQVVQIEGEHALRVEREGHGSWHSLAPYAGRDGDDRAALAERIADRVVRRELGRRAAWRLRRDDEHLETTDVVDAYAFCQAPWHELELRSLADARRLTLRRDGEGLEVTFRGEGEAATARTDDPAASLPIVAHMLLRREPSPALSWTR